MAAIVARVGGFALACSTLAWRRCLTWSHKSVAQGLARPGPGRDPRRTRVDATAGALSAFCRGPDRSAVRCGIATTVARNVPTCKWMCEALYQMRHLLLCTLPAVGPAVLAEWFLCGDVLAFAKAQSTPRTRDKHVFSTRPKRDDAHSPSVFSHSVSQPIHP